MATTQYQQSKKVALPKAALKDAQGAKTSGVKIRGTGAATKGVMARGPLA